MTETNVIRNAGWVVSWDADNQRHEYMQDADVVFKGSEIIHVGKNYIGAADHEIAGDGLCVMPGLINLHSHTLAPDAGAIFLSGPSITIIPSTSAIMCNALCASI